MYYFAYSIDYEAPYSDSYEIIGFYKTKEKAEKAIIRNIFNIHNIYDMICSFECDYDSDDEKFNLLEEHLKELTNNIGNIDIKNLNTNNIDIDNYYKKYNLEEIIEFWGIYYGEYEGIKYYIKEVELS